jgi:Asp/Glu/hydantoin racemase
MTTRIALIHALAMSIPPVAQSFKQLWPEAETFNVLDDALSSDRARDKDLTPAIIERISQLGRYAMKCDANGILYSCSAFGPAIDAVARWSAIPVLKPNEAMFEEALQKGGRTGLLLTFQPSAESMKVEFKEQAAGRKFELEVIVVPEAMAALQKGNAEEQNRLLAEAAAKAGPFDALMLGQFSMAPARGAVQAAVKCPVLTSPDSAVRKLRGLLVK